MLILEDGWFQLNCCCYVPWGHCRLVTENRPIPFNCLLLYVWPIQWQNCETKISTLLWVTHHALRLIKKEREPLTLGFKIYAFRKASNAKQVLSVWKKPGRLQATLAPSEVLAKFPLISQEYYLFLDAYSPVMILTCIISFVCNVHVACFTSHPLLTIELAVLKRFLCSNTAVIPPSVIELTSKQPTLNIWNGETSTY